MNLIVDAGNTSVKLAVFAAGQLVYDDTISNWPKSQQGLSFIESVKKIFGRYPNIQWAIVSSVGSLGSADITALSIFCKVHVLGHESQIPFKNSYATPKTLGVDRLALVTAAYYAHVKTNTLVIDAGTCVTYDMITEGGEYLGGAISPGLQMRYLALHRQTAKLPLLKASAPDDLIGNSTETGMHSGVVNGICQEIDGIIGQYKTRFSDLTVILTGGDAQFLSKRLKNTIFADSKFLLVGLNHILEYNKH